MLNRLTDLQRGKREGSYFGTVLRQNVRTARKNIRAKVEDTKKHGVRRLRRAANQVGRLARAVTERSPQMIVARASARLGARLGSRIRRNR